MTVDTFNALLAGPLYGMTVNDTLNRLCLALLHVVNTCGDTAEAALLQWCADREAKDKRGGG